MTESSIVLLATFVVILLLSTLWMTSDHKVNLQACMKSGQSLETCEFYLK